MNKPSPLDETQNSAYAWARYRLMMKRLGMLTVAIVVVALFALWKTGEAASIHFYIATAIAISGVMLVTGALMGLIFLSNGTGHDESIHHPTDSHWDEDDDHA
ncbi:hypothetical protein [Pseudoblastomonas halimionae]|uniref:Uncharacterized protein n=1 Tax=Alteriqipengyuania halimionae TaxID=1926630 RepID=A0A6I4U966_9SPHN|nr:hypothetical protein [Alteriqipengyuania halimionae]MXP10827.1 hypothetical protein [Alteriqipengyuania halimionae]